MVTRVGWEMSTSGDLPFLYKVDTQQWNEMGINDSFLQCQVHNGNHQIIGLVNYTVLI